MFHDFFSHRKKESQHFVNIDFHLSLKISGKLTSIKFQNIYGEKSKFILVDRNSGFQKFSNRRRS